MGSKNFITSKLILQRFEVLKERMNDLGFHMAFV